MTVMPGPPATIRGLSDAEAQARRAQGLGNSLPPATSRGYVRIVRDNVFTFINLVLFALGIALVLVGRPTDALISVGIISINIAVSVVQEIRAKRTLDQIALLTRPTATVVRDGQERTLQPEELVVGDVLKVGPGDQILVDGRVIGDGRMAVDESQLTGESNLVPKGPGDPVYSGSYCVSGTASYEAEKVGDASFANELTASARAFRRVLTPLQREINLAIRLILLIVIYLEVLLVITSAIKSISFAEGVAHATVVAGLVPNGLLLAIAVAYALGAVRIARLGALVQQSNAIESLSNVNVLCLDKTGTLTTNKLKVHEIHPIGVDQQELANILGAMTASATGRNKTGDTIGEAFPAQPRQLAAEVPFSSARKWSAVAFADEHLQGVYALGAPEMLRPHLGSAGDDASPVWHAIARQVSHWAGQGLRVLLVAHHADPALLEDRGDESRLPDNMTPIGLVSLSDELRPDAREILADFIRHGVKPKIISGDNLETVAALAIQAGLDPDVRLVSGLELAKMSAAEFDEAAASATIFGRITPQQKEQLVEALRQHGHYVAMIGDGVNDVLSLKKSNLGIAMQSGSQATRGVADIILLNDSFAALAPAVSEGQRILNGMQDILKLFMARIFTMALLILSALVVGVFPINLRHASIITLWSVGIPSVLLAVWARPGPGDRRPLVGRLMHFVVPAAVMSTLLGLAIFYGTFLYRASHVSPALSGLPAAQALAIITLQGQTFLAAFLVVVGLLLIIFVEPPSEWWAGADVPSGDWRPTALAIGLLVGFIVIMAVPALRGFFNLQPMDPWNILAVVAASLVWLFTVRLVWRHRLLERFFAVG